MDNRNKHIYLIKMTSKLHKTNQTTSQDQDQMIPLLIRFKDSFKITKSNRFINK